MNSMLKSASRLLLTTAVALAAAGVAALTFVYLPRIWFVATVLALAILACAGAVWARKSEKRAERRSAAAAEAARLAEHQRRADALKAREAAIQKAQLDVIASFRREHGIGRHV